MAPAFAAAQRARALAAKASPQRAGADRGACRSATPTTQGRPRRARCRLRRGHGEGRGAVSGRQRDRGALRRSGDGPQSLGLLAAGRATSRTRRAARSCRRWSACSPRTPTIRARSTITSMRWRRRTGPSAPSPMPTGCAAPFRAPAISCTCRATSTTGSAAISTRSRTTRPRRRWTRNTWRRATRPMGVYRLGYYPHNVHFVLASAQMAGDGANRHRGGGEAARPHPRRGRARHSWCHPVKAAPYFAHALFSSPDADPGATRSRRLDSVREGDVALRPRRGLRGAGAISPQPGPRRTPSTRSSAPRISRCSRRPAFRRRRCCSLRARWSRAALAQAQGDSDKAVERFEQAAALQDALPYTEPPYWYYPVRQSLAAALMQAGRLAEAEEQFRRALARAPNNGWSYYGLARTLQGAWRRRRRAKSGGGTGEDLGGRSPATANLEAVRHFGHAVRRQQAWRPAATSAAVTGNGS